MDSRLQEMLDHHEVRRTLNEYCHGCDRCDEPLMASVYAQDSWDDHGAIKGPGATFTREMIADIRQRTETLSHLLGQTLISLAGDEAGAETYFLAAFRSRLEGGEQVLSQLGGRYLDRLHRQDGRWLISRRTVVRDWSVTLPLTLDFVAGEGLKEGARSGLDPSYAVLGLIDGAAKGSAFTASRGAAGT